MEENPTIAPVDCTFPRSWHAEILPARPVILPARHFVYPLEAEEVERGALEVLVRPDEVRHDTVNTQPFLATCALGFRDAALPTGIWSAPNPREICAVSGGYVYLIDTLEPKRFTMIPFRPVLAIHPRRAEKLLLFIGHHAVLAWGERGGVWQSEKLSDEGVAISAVEDGVLHGLGWNMMTDQETPFALDIRTGLRLP